MADWYATALEGAPRFQVGPVPFRADMFLLEACPHLEHPAKERLRSQATTSVNFCLLHTEGGRYQRGRPARLRRGTTAQSTQHPGATIAGPIS